MATMTKKSIITIIASVSTMVLVGLAAIGWVIFIGGFGAYNSDTEFFKKIDAFNSLLPPDQAAQRRESSFAPYNSHYIVAVLSPILFIMMIMMSVLMMVLKKTWATYVFISISAPILILVGFVLVSGGTVLYLYSTAITSGRHARSSSGPGVSSPINAMFAGMFLETIFLIGALFALFSGTILAVAERKDADKSTP